VKLCYNSDETKHFYIVVTRFSSRAEFPDKINYHLDAGRELPCRKIYWETTRPVQPARRAPAFYASH